jgi:hypothetical protein
MIFIQGLNIPKYGKTGRKLIQCFVSRSRHLWHVMSRYGSAVQLSAYRGLEASSSPLTTWVKSSLEPVPLENVVLIGIQFAGMNRTRPLRLQGHMTNMLLHKT